VLRARIPGIFHCLYICLQVQLCLLIQLQFEVQGMASSWQHAPVAMHTRVWHYSVASRLAAGQRNFLSAVVGLAQLGYTCRSYGCPAWGRHQRGMLLTFSTLASHPSAVPAPYIVEHLQLLPLSVAAWWCADHVFECKSATQTLAAWNRSKLVRNAHIAEI
jgi:hypothetical protein